jgi:hypothetical protein
MKKLLPLIILVFMSLACALGDLGQNTPAATVTRPAASATSTLSPTGTPTRAAEATPTANAVPPPTGEDIVRLFFALIDEGRIPEAVAMLDAAAAPDDATRQAWGVTFNHMESVTVAAIQAWDDGTWTDNQKEYKVTLEVQLKPDTPEVGWLEGENTRWVVLVYNPGQAIWQIHTVGTGP